MLLLSTLGKTPLPACVKVYVFIHLSKLPLSCLQVLTIMIKPAINICVIFFECT